MKKLYKKLSNEQMIMVALRSILYNLNNLKEPYNRNYGEDEISDELWKRIEAKK